MNLKIIPEHCKKRINLEFFEHLLFPLEIDPQSLAVETIPKPAVNKAALMKDFWDTHFQRQKDK